MHFRMSHPWDPRNALPAHVLAEPPRFGTLTTAYARRGTIDPAAVPAPWKTGYAYPSYLRSEPLGRGVLRTKYMPRRTVDTLVPAYLGSDDNYVGGGSDPIAKFGDTVSRYLMTTIFSLPPAARKPALKALFDQLDPKLYGRVTAKAEKLERQGVNPRAALGRAIAASTATGLLEEFIAAGKKSQLPPIKSFLGLGIYSSARQMVLEGYLEQLESMGGIWGSIKGAVSDAGSAVKSAVKSGGSTIKSAVTAPFSAAKTLGEKAYEWGKTAINKIGQLTCAVASNPLAQAAAGGVGAAYGGPQGAQAATAGVGIVNGVCGGGAQAPALPPAPPKSSLPSWVVPAAIAGGAGILVLLLTK